MIARVALALLLVTPPNGRPPDRWFGADKLKHFFIAAFTQSVAYSGLQGAKVREDRALLGAWAVTATISVAKELHDRRSYGVFSYRDLAWDAAGAGAATLALRRAVERGRGTASHTEVPEAARSSVASLLTDVGPGPILPRGPMPRFAPRR